MILQIKGRRVEDKAVLPFFFLHIFLQFPNKNKCSKNRCTNLIQYDIIKSAFT